MDVTRLRALGGHVREQEDALLRAASGDSARRQSIAERAARGVRRPAARHRTGIGVAAAAALVLSTVGLFFWAHRTTEGPPLTFTTGNPERPGLLGEWVSASDEALPLRFSDGTRIALEPKGRARVLRVSAHGAELAIESGRAFVTVVPMPSGDWRVRSGPFVVHVTGTRFEVGWYPDADELRLKLYEGHVTVSGCALGSGHAVNAGEELRASCRGRELSVLPLGDAPEKAVVAIDSPAPPAANDTSPSRASKPELRAPSRPSWLELAREGRYRDAHELAKTIGFDAECGRLGAESLLLLADAARLDESPRDASQAYKTLRARFPGRAPAARAAFHLGELDSRAGNEQSATGWYETYLAEQPSGPLADAARGRLLEGRVKLGDLPGAHRVADIYLQQYPTGAHADEARKVLQTSAGTK